MLLQIFVRAKRSLWSRDKDAFKLAATFRNDKLETRCIMTIRSNVIDPKPRLFQEACRFSSTFVTDSLPGETVTTYSYTRILFRCSPPFSRGTIFRAAKKWEKHGVAVGRSDTRGFRRVCTAGRGEYTRRARRIMGICGRQVAKLYREAGNKRANGSYVRREILWRRVCNGLGGTRVCGLTSIKPSKSYYLSRLAD